MAVKDEWEDVAYRADSSQQMDWDEPYTDPAHWPEDEEDEADAHTAGEEEWKEEEEEEEDWRESWNPSPQISLMRIRKMESKTLMTPQNLNAVQ